MTPSRGTLLLPVILFGCPTLLCAGVVSDCLDAGHGAAEGSGLVQHVVGDTALIQVVTSVGLSWASLETAGRPYERTAVATDTTPPPGVLQVSGNSAADLEVLLSAILTNLIVIAAALTVFSVLRRRFPLVYNGRAEVIDDLGITPSTSFFGWVRDTLMLSSEDVEKASTLDHAMLIQFCKLCMRITLSIGLPSICILCPMHALFGGKYAGADQLSYLGFANVQPGSWLCYLHAAVVWAVVYAAMTMIYNVQEKIFLPRRFAWLRSMPPVRAKTVLIEAIPRQYCSDEALKAYFTSVFSEAQVESVHMVKHTQGLVGLLRDMDARVSTLQYERRQWEMNGSKADERPDFMTFQFHKGRPRCSANHLMAKDDRFSHVCDSCGITGTAYRCSSGCEYDLCLACADQLTSNAPGSRVDTMNYYEDTAHDLMEQAAAERKRFKHGASSKGDNMYSSSAFVTFRDRRDAVMALQVQYMQDESKMVASIPPEPGDVIFSDLQVSPVMQKVCTVIGWALVAGLFWSFLPFVISISAFTNLHQLEASASWIKTLTATYPTLSIVLDGVLASLALTIFMDFLPTILNMIFYSFFQLRSSNWAQLYLQTAYFWFMVMFVVLITAIGGSLAETIKDVLESPSKVPVLLAEALPVSSHFYMKYLVLQWATPAIGMLRIVQLMKFVLFRAIWGDEHAKVLSEPEDQDYYGIGARSARFAINMVIVLVFCSLSPIILVLGFVNFALNHLFFEYLFVFAETRKNDLGGVFWVRQLDHLQYGLIIYIVLEVGCLAQRGDGNWPWMLSMPAFIIWAWMFMSFKRLRWESLPFEEVAGVTEPAKGAGPTATYLQPELEEASGEAMQKVRGRWSVLARMRDPIVKPMLNAFGFRSKGRRSTRPAAKKS